MDDIIISSIQKRSQKTWCVNEPFCPADQSDGLRPNISSVSLHLCWQSAHTAEKSNHFCWLSSCYRENSIHCLQRRLQTMFTTCTFFSQSSSVFIWSRFKSSTLKTKLRFFFVSIQTWNDLIGGVDGMEEVDCRVEMILLFLHSFEHLAWRCSWKKINCKSHPKKEWFLEELSDSNIPDTIRRVKRRGGAGALSAQKH